MRWLALTLVCALAPGVNMAVGHPYNNICHKHIFDDGHAEPLKGCKTMDQIRAEQIKEDRRETPPNAPGKQRVRRLYD